MRMLRNCCRKNLDLVTDNPPKLVNCAFHHVRMRHDQVESSIASSTFCLARMIRTRSLRGAACGRIQIRSPSLFQEMRVVVALHSGLGPVRMKLDSKKVAHRNRCSNLPGGSRANTRPGHVAAQSQWREANIWPSEFGFRQFGRCVKFQCD